MKFLKLSNLFLLSTLIFFPIASHADSSSLTHTQWKLVRLNNSPILSDTQITLQFKADGKLSSKAWNLYWSQYTLDQKQLLINSLAQTMLICVKQEINEQETRYLSLLAKAAEYLIQNQTLEIITQEGEKLIFSAS